MKFRVEHRFSNITVEQYEELYFNEDFNNALCADNKLSRTLEKLDRSDTHISRVVTVGSNREVPGAMARIIGSTTISYGEYMEYDIGSYRGTWRTKSSVLTDKVDASGTFEFIGDGSGVRRVVQGSLRVKILGAGRLVERFVVADVEKSYARAAEFTQRWIDDGKL